MANTLKNSRSFAVIVGNVGTVYNGKNAREAAKTYNEYVKASKAGHGRAGHESVTLLSDLSVERAYTSPSQA